MSASSDDRPLDPLPIEEVLPRLIGSLKAEPNLVLTAPPGAGKSTRVPPKIVRELSAICPGRWLVLQPRRVAAVSVAARIADEQGWKLGREVGYQVRFEQCLGPQTPLILMTDGMLLRQLHDNPWFDGIAGIVLDEFHERSLNTDLILALARRVQSELRPELRIMVMSATLAAEAVATFLSGPIIHSPGRMYPVEITQFKYPDSRPLESQIVAAVSECATVTAGDLLVFLPGRGEITRTHRALAEELSPESFRIEELYGELPLADQQRVLAPSDRRKIILATNVAETSLTIPGVTGVIDSGLARVLRWDAVSGINRLAVERISSASAAQRAGRAGRTAPGICRQLWSPQESRVMPERDTPELLRIDLTGAVLELLNQGESDPRAFPWFDPPDAAALQSAVQRLQQWGAVTDDGRLTAIGRELVRLPTQPRLARLVLAGRDHGVLEAATLAAALIGERDPFRRREQSSYQSRPNHHSDSDIMDRVSALREHAQTNRRDTWLGMIDPYSAKQVIRAAKQLYDAVSEISPGFTTCEDDSAEEVGLRRALAAAFADRIAKRREPNSPRALLVGGRGVRLTPQSAVREAELFAAVELRDGTGNEALVTLASAVLLDDLPAEQIVKRLELRYDDNLQKVVARQITAYQDLVLRESTAAVPKESWSEAAALLADVAVRDHEKLFPEESAVRKLLNRWAWLVEKMPTADLPIYDAALLTQLIRDHAGGCLSMEELLRRPWLDYLRGAFDYAQMQLLEREAPERYTVPSGSRIAIDYQPGKPPRLSVRIQELFGLASTPRLAGGRLPLLLELLGPNFRPQQLTEDLAGFWKNTYPEVKKELKRRYPKHSWPDDPLTAAAQNKGGKRHGE